MVKMTAEKGMVEFLSKCKKQNKKTVLDIGCGEKQPHSKVFRQSGLDVYTCDFFENNDYQGKFTEIDFEGKQFDAVWCAHCLEHQPDPGIFLRTINKILKDDGLLCITVPPLKHNIVGGHLTLWNIGLLYYNLILAGFDCSKGIHSQYKYNLSIIVNKNKITNFPRLNYDTGDIETLSKYFPFEASQGFDGNLLPNTF